jgi:ribosomal protein L13E
VREGARQAGREFAKLEIMAAAAVRTSDDLSIPVDHRDKHRPMEILHLNVLE